MNNDNLIGTKGLKIISIDCTEVDFEINRLSELDENWVIPSKCPTCNCDISFNKNNVNKLITCKCGQQLQLQILEKLL